MMSYYGTSGPTPQGMNAPLSPQASQSYQPCPHQPGTLLRVFIPAGAVINLANLLEVSSPSGICLLVRIPALGGNRAISNIMEAVKKVGGTVEFA